MRWLARIWKCRKPIINDTMTSKIGEHVLVKDESVRRGRSKKLEAPYVGPYEIVGIEGPNLLLRTR